MKIPAWFVIGCGLLVLNLVLVLGGSLSIHASAEPPDETQKPADQQPAEAGPSEASLAAPGAEPPTLSEPPLVVLPTVPSLESSAPLASSIVSLEEVRNAVDQLQPSTELLTPLDTLMQDTTASAPVSEQLSHSFFESMKLRLKTVKYLNESVTGLVDEAAILYQRGEIAEAQKLLGLATQLRETTARLLVTHQ